jgi:hypothetical protein
MREEALKFGGYITARETAYMNHKSDLAFLIKGKKYKIKGILLFVVKGTTYRKIYITSEIDNRHYFDVSQLKEYFLSKEEESILEELNEIDKII